MGNENMFAEVTQLNRATAAYRGRRTRSEASVRRRTKMYCGLNKDGICWNHEACCASYHESPVDN